MPSSKPPCVPEHLSSHDVEPALRFDSWRERAHQWVELQPLPPGAELDAELLILRSQTCIFGTMRSSAYEMRAASRRLANAPDMVVVTLIQSGELLRDAAPGELQRVGPGTLGLYDPRRMGNYRWSQGSREVFLALQRDDVRAALGREPGNVPIPLERCVLAPALASQLNHLALLARQPQKLDGVEYAGLLEGTRELALLMLRNLGRQDSRTGQSDMEEDLNAGRHAAALRFMDREAHRHDLDATAIARGAGCSRTRLYAAFASRGETVMGTLREIRLQRAKELIERSPRLHIGSLSWRCGFADQSGFSKLFKMRFGLLPSEWHHQTWAPPTTALPNRSAAPAGFGPK
ncbi:Transcriptional activator FeaR [Pigmentiphaga humi]|uniref:Transcriptional activator FeaR n=1 Tax=Pigmentiphaga humi TaxID=2478468 RepID=A0A3P4B7I4_9BURK|nr:AraC family transcriptional regulator [Pigmentiphaga humi]VCU71476.1 Transcriptional activator FeaR [Pigmentiphaga humi]